MNEYMLKRYHERRELAYDLLGRKCVRCGSTELPLSIDHIDPATKSFEFGHANGKREAQWIIELQKCQMLCWSCHSKKTNLEMGKKLAQGTHGTLSAYRYCRPSCDACRKARAEYTAAFRLKYGRNGRKGIAK